jgi:hypothetical protein
MALPISGQVAQSIAAVRATGNPTLLQAQLGEAAVSEILPRYGALAWSGLMYYTAHSAAQALSVNSATFTGLAVANPTGSGKNLIIVDAVCAIAAVGANAVMTPKLGYAATVALTQGNAISATGSPVLVGSSGSSVAKTGASGTLGAAPTTIRPLMGFQWITGGTGMWNLIAKDEIAGAIVIPPGQMLTLDALTAACTVLASFSWIEVPT